MENLNKKIVNATKWSSMTEIIAKLIVPITNMILARVLAPEAFGVVATITMIISFADMFTDAGFQKYLVQHEFKSEEDRVLANNVAFWTNFVISVLLWIFISIFSDQIAIMVGNPGLGNVIIVACIQLPLTSFSSIQMAIYRRSFDFKTLFLVRIVGVCMPFIVTIPLAMLGYSYWSLIIGTICGNLSNAIILTIKSKWKPQYVYKFYVLKEMLSFSIWSLIEAIAIWLTSWIDTFIIGSILNSYYLGIYKTSLTSVNAVFALITSATTPILFSALSRLQNDNAEFEKMFFNMQKMVSYLVLPMSVGMFIYADIVVKILLGDKWPEASGVVSIWSITSGLVIILSHYSSEVYRAKGKPKLSFVAQTLNLIFIILVCAIASRYDFSTLVNLRAIARLEGILVHIVFMQFIIGIPALRMLKNITIPLISSIIMGLIGIKLRQISLGLSWSIISILICIICYFTILLCFKTSREDIKVFIYKLNINEKIKKITKSKRLQMIFK